jgi:hypothetical protein
VERDGEENGLKSENVFSSHFPIQTLHLEREYSEPYDCSGDIARTVILRFPRVSNSEMIVKGVLSDFSTDRVFG